MHLKCRLLSCIVLDYSAVICSIWFLRLSFVKCTFWLSSSVLPCSSHNPCICKLKFLMFCHGYNNLVDKNNNLLCFWVCTISGNSNNVVIKSINYFLLSMVCYYQTKLLYSRLVHFYVQGSTFMGILYFVWFMWTYYG